jgi:hypothetical protein
LHNLVDFETVRSRATVWSGTRFPPSGGFLVLYKSLEQPPVNSPKKQMDDKERNDSK